MTPCEEVLGDSGTEKKSCLTPRNSQNLIIIIIITFIYKTLKKKKKQASIEVIWSLFQVPVSSCAAVF